MITYVPDNLWGEMLPSIDNHQLVKDCLVAEKYILDSDWRERKEYHQAYGSKTTSTYLNYNLLSFPVESFQNLYHSIVSVIKPCLPDETHVLQCWLNVFHAGKSIDWHTHWVPEHRVIHGFYCVNVTPSFTEYKFPDNPDKIYKIDSKEGLLVFGKSNDNRHRSSPWNNDTVPRITIAFDLVPISTLYGKQILPNHFLPV